MEHELYGWDKYRQGVGAQHWPLAGFMGGIYNREKGDLDGFDMFWGMNS